MRRRRRRTGRPPLPLTQTAPFPDPPLPAAAGNVAGQRPVARRRRIQSSRHDLRVMGASRLDPAMVAVASTSGGGGGLQLDRGGGDDMAAARDRRDSDRKMEGRLEAVMNLGFPSSCSSALPFVGRDVSRRRFGLFIAP